MLSGNEHFQRNGNGFVKSGEASHEFQHRYTSGRDGSVAPYLRNRSCRKGGNRRNACTRGPVTLDHVDAAERVEDYRDGVVERLRRGAVRSPRAEELAIGEKTWTRLLLSDTKTRPCASTAMPIGPLSSPVTSAVAIPRHEGVALRRELQDTVCGVGHPNIAIAVDRHAVRQQRGLSSRGERAPVGVVDRDRAGVPIADDDMTVPVDGQGNGAAGRVRGLILVPAARARATGCRRCRRSANSVRNVRSGLNFWIRWFPASAT